MLYYPLFLVPASQLLRHAMASVSAILRQKTVFNFAPKPVLHCVYGNSATMNITKCTEIALCASLAYCNKSTQIIRCFSKQPPHNCFRYLLHDLLDPTHSTALQTTLLNVVRCSTLPHNQMWFDVAAEVNVGSLRVLSDHIADHTGPDRGAK